ncbi:MAG TPA: hypothetical protein VFL29_05485 [Candidatus Dormibacteraeota bacterium]|nr:hypothetical protein [Candidatus Dormibacteraeota bacterium]
MLVRYSLWSQLGASIGLWAFFIVCGAVVFFGMRPPYVRANAEQVWANGLESFFAPTRMPRADLAYIFRGRALVGNRFKTWQPAYFLVTKDETPKIALLGETFTDEGMTELAKRLDVPIKGDFTAQIR